MSDDPGLLALMIDGDARIDANGTLGVFESTTKSTRPAEKTSK